MLKRTVLILAFAVMLGVSAGTKITVDAGRKAAPVNHRLAGVSQGGNAGSFFKPEIRTRLDGFPLPLVRIEMITNSLPYSLYDASTGKFNWTKLDDEIEAVQKRGGEVMINLFGTPSHLASDPSAKVPAFTPPGDFQAYADFCAEIVRHVNIEKKYGVRLWEFWNEPSGGWFWSTWPSKGGSESFFRLYSMVARTVKAVDPNALVGGFGDNMQYPEHYQGWFRFLKKDPAPVDFLTVHYYGDWSGKTAPDPESYAVLTDRLAAIAKRELGRVPPIYLTEWNLAAESNGKFSAAETAAWIGSSLCRMQRNGKLEGAALFRIEHYRDPYSSLFDHAGELRVPARMLKNFCAIPADGIAAASSSADTAIVAGKDGEKLSMLIARFNRAEGATGEKASVEVKRLKPDTNYQVSIRREDSIGARQGGEGDRQKTQAKSDGSGTLRFGLELEPCSAVYVVIE